MIRSVWLSNEKMKLILKEREKFDVGMGLEER